VAGSEKLRRERKGGGAVDRGGGIHNVNEMVKIKVGGVRGKPDTTILKEKKTKGNLRDH